MELNARNATNVCRPKAASILGARTLGAITATLAVAGGFSACSSTDAETTEPALVQREASWVIDPNDKVALMEWADEVFVGSVEKQGETDVSDPRLPQTHYTVKVERVIDGGTPSEVEVVQDGGVTGDGKELLLFAGDELYEPGSIRLFAVRVVDGQRYAFPIVGSEELETQREQTTLIADYTEAVGVADKSP